jgi:hypothetical protein
MKKWWFKGGIMGRIREKIKEKVSGRRTGQEALFGMSVPAEGMRIIHLQQMRVRRGRVLMPL